MLPSVSWAMAMHPYSPMENFDWMMVPPAAVTRDSSVAQSWQEK